MEQTKTLSKEEYNEIPVHYCSRCLSLKIRIMGDTEDYCDVCGCTDILTTNINEWEQMYENKYGINFLKEKKNGKERSKI